MYQACREGRKSAQRLKHIDRVPFEPSSTSGTVLAVLQRSLISSVLL